jgi:hypothetical protein
MDFIIERQFIERLGETLEGFERKRSDLYTFRCPVCGDSKTDPKKRRGFIYRQFGKTRFKCHKCGVSESLAAFIRRMDEDLCAEFLNFADNAVTSGAQK